MSLSFYFVGPDGNQQMPTASGQEAGYRGASHQHHAAIGYAYPNPNAHQQLALHQQQNYHHPQEQHYGNAAHAQHGGTGTYHPPHQHHAPPQSDGAYGGYRGPMLPPPQPHAPSQQQHCYRPPQVPGAVALNVRNHSHHDVYSDIGQLQRHYQGHYFTDDTPHARAFATYQATGGQNYPFIATIPHRAPNFATSNAYKDGTYQQLGYPHHKHHHHKNQHHDNNFEHHTNNHEHHTNNHEQTLEGHHEDHEPTGDEGNHYEASEYKIISEECRYENWKKIVSQVTLLPNGKIADFEVVDQKGEGGVVIFAWNTHDKTATLIREYNPGCKRMMYGMAGGLIEADKHAQQQHHPDGDEHQTHNGGDNDEPEYHGREWKEHHTDQEFDEMAFRAAHAELEEEAHLGGGKWIRLVDKGVSIPIEKYFTCEVVPYLVFDAHIVQHPASRDAEELIEIHSGITAQKVRELLLAGEMHALGGYVALLALEKLREIGEIE